MSNCHMSKSAGPSAGNAALKAHLYVPESGTASSLCTMQLERGSMKRAKRGVNSCGSAAARKFRMAVLADPGAPLPPRRPLLFLILGHRTLTRTDITSVAGDT